MWKILDKYLVKRDYYIYCSVKVLPFQRMRMLQKIFHKFYLIAAPIIISALILISYVLLEKNSDIGRVLVAFFIFLPSTYGFYHYFIRIYKKIQEESTCAENIVRENKWLTYYLYGWSAFLCFVGFMLIARKPHASLLFLVVASAMILLVYKQKQLNQQAFQFQKIINQGPPYLHTILESEIEKWEPSLLEKHIPFTYDLLKVSELIISEGEEDIKDRPKIEAFYSNIMKEMISDLTRLRKLLLGKQFLNLSQKHEIEELKKQLVSRQADLQTFYQGIVG